VNTGPQGFIGLQGAQGDIGSQGLFGPQAPLIKTTNPLFAGEQGAQGYPSEMIGFQGHQGQARLDMLAGLEHKEIKDKLDHQASLVIKVFKVNKVIKDFRYPVYRVCKEIPLLSVVPRDQQDHRDRSVIKDYKATKGIAEIKVCWEFRIQAIRGYKALLDQLEHKVFRVSRDIRSTRLSRLSRLSRSSGFSRNSRITRIPRITWFSRMARTLWSPRSSRITRIAGFTRNSRISR
jgi:hypothetical protein